ncbi:MAG: hypothetical protein FWF99_01605 [Desulfovibrionaceae bacterium]|nr:hypothetical protein [Desulfovibrionaceae bacterium]
MSNDFHMLLHENTLRYQTLPESAVVERHAPYTLLTPNRLDILARYEFARYYLQGHCLDLGHEIYTNLIQTWHEQTGGFDPGHTCLDDYVRKFCALIDSFREYGFDENRSIIPLVQGSIVDGAHRVAAALALGIEKLPCVTLLGEPQRQDAETLRSIGVNPFFVDTFIQRHIELDLRMRAAVFFPCAAEKLHEGLALFASRNEILHSTDVHVTKRGMQNLVTELYGDLDWWDDYQEKTFAARRYRRGSPATIIFYRQGVEDMQSFKDKVRAVLQQGNDSLHTTDDHSEAVAIARVVHNKNSLDCLNYGRKAHTPVFKEKFALYKAILKKHPDDESKFALVSGGTLAAYGLRDVRDIDYIFDKGAPDIEDVENKINNHNLLYLNIPFREDLLINDPRHFFYKYGVKFVSADIVKLAKGLRGKLKDTRDVLMLKYRRTLLSVFFRQLNTLLLRIHAVYLYFIDFIHFLKNIIKKQFHRGVMLIKRSLPEPVYQRLRRLYHIVLFK